MAIIVGNFGTQIVNEHHFGKMYKCLSFGWRWKHEHMFLMLVCPFGPLLPLIESDFPEKTEIDAPEEVLLGLLTSAHKERECHDLIFLLKGIAIWDPRR